MDTTVIIALTSAIASLLVALISLITALITNRNSLRTAVSLERLKHTLARSNRAFEMGDSELGSSLEALKLAMRAIQKFKDEIQLIIFAYGASLDSVEALERLEAARQHIFQIYEEVHPNLTEHEAVA